MFLPMSWTSPLTVAITIRPLPWVAPVFSFSASMKGMQMRDRFLHHAGRLDHLRKEHLARPEQVADDVHAVHQRAFDDLDRPREQMPRFLGIVDDVGVDALDQRVGQALADRQRAPFGALLLLGGVGAAKALGERDQPFGRVRVLGAGRG